MTHPLPAGPVFRTGRPGAWSGAAAIVLAATALALALKVVALGWLGQGVMAVALANWLCVLPVMAIYVPRCACQLAELPLARLYREAYLPPLVPQPYGEHLLWAWNRMLEQSWYFPWYKPEQARRLPAPHADPAALHAQVMDLLVSGDAYRHGYRAALSAGFDVPPADADVPPAFLSSYTSDPMTAHIARFPPLPAGWETAVQPGPAAHYAAAMPAAHPTLPRVRPR